MRLPPLVAISVALFTLLPSGLATGRVTGYSAGGFALIHEIVLPVPPAEAFAAFTGEIGGWWDHAFSKHPRRLFIDARPGGAFCEVFDDQGNGAVHARVTYVERGKRLRFVGPLGLAGEPLEMIHTVDFESSGGGTRMKLAVTGVGQIDAGWPPVVDRVWNHFLVERFQPHVKAGQHRARAPFRPPTSIGACR
jgi:uncharacterized protein YndB with AHSA1/START domain